MMKLSILLVIVSFMFVPVLAQFEEVVILEDPFDETGLSSEWEWFWSDSPRAVVASDTDWRGVAIEPREDGDGYFLRLEYSGAAWSTHGIQAGDISKANYTLEAYVYLAYEAGAAVTPQFVGHYTAADSYSRVQFRYRDDMQFPAENNVRVQAQEDGDWHAVTITSYSDTAEEGIYDGEGWYHVRAEWMFGPRISVYVNDRHVGIANLSVAPSVNAGRFALASFSYGNHYGGASGTGSAQQVYWDDFKAYYPAIPTFATDWTQFE